MKLGVRAARLLTARRAVLSAILLTAPGVVLITAGCARDDRDADPIEDDGPSLIDGGSGQVESDASLETSTPDAAAACGTATWCMVETHVSPSNLLRAVWGTGASDVWAAGSGGTIIHYDGSDWSPVSSGVRNTINAIWGSGPDDVYLAGSADAIFHGARGAGQSPVVTKLALGREGIEGKKINTVWGTSPDDVRLGTDAFDYFDDFWRSATQLVLARSDAGEPGWTPTPVRAEGDPYGGIARCIWGTSSQDFWISASELLRPGREAIVYHARAGSAGIVVTEVDSQSSSIIESIYGTSPNDVWAVGAGGTIRHISSADVRWQVVTSPTRENLRSVWASAPDDVWAVGDKGTILHYDGKTFTLSDAQLPPGRTPDLYGVWGSGPHDVWIVGDAIALHYAGPKSAKEATSLGENGTP